MPYSFILEIRNDLHNVYLAYTMIIRMDKLLFRRAALTIFMAFTLVFVLFLPACSKDKTPDNADQKLYDLTKDTSGYVWYKFSDTLLPRSSGSGHGQPFLKTRFNAIAANYLDGNGKVINGTTFPEGSVIIKELYKADSTLDQYAILWKNQQSPSADVNGWVWGYLKPNGTVVTAASSQGSTCINCHSQPGHINQTLMNAYFP